MNVNCFKWYVNTIDEVFNTIFTLLKTVNIKKSLYGHFQRIPNKI